MVAGALRPSPGQVFHFQLCTSTIHNYVQVAELASLAQLLLPCSPTVRNSAPDSSLCRAASPRLRPLQLLLPIARLLLPNCVRFNRCSPIAQLLLARLRPLQLLLPDCVRFNCCSPDFVRFDCCSPIAYIRLLDSSPCPGPMFSNILRGV